MLTCYQQLAGCGESLQLRVLRLGFLQDGDVGVGVFPERKKVLVGGAGVGVIALWESVGAGETEAGEDAERRIPHQATICGFREEPCLTCARAGGAPSVRRPVTSTCAPCKSRTKRAFPSGPRRFEEKCCRSHETAGLSEKNGPTLQESGHGIGLGLVIWSCDRPHKPLWKFP
jgi:hypothetical protein